MPQLHLPADHATRDLVLAHRIAEAVESRELYVAWSHAAGAGQRPEVQAEVREAPTVAVEVLTVVMGWLSTLVDAVVEAVLDSRRTRGTQPPAGAQGPGPVSVRP